MDQGGSGTVLDIPVVPIDEGGNKILKLVLQGKSLLDQLATYLAEKAAEFAEAAQVTQTQLERWVTNLFGNFQHSFTRNRTVVLVDDPSNHLADWESKEPNVEIITRTIYDNLAKPLWGMLREAGETADRGLEFAQTMWAAIRQFYNDCVESASYQVYVYGGDKRGEAPLTSTVNGLTHFPRAHLISEPA